MQDEDAKSYLTPGLLEKPIVHLVSYARQLSIIRDTIFRNRSQQFPLTSLRHVFDK